VLCHRVPQRFLRSVPGFQSGLLIPRLGSQLRLHWLLYRISFDLLTDSLAAPDGRCDSSTFDCFLAHLTDHGLPGNDGWVFPRTSSLLLSYSLSRQIALVTTRGYRHVYRGFLPLTNQRAYLRALGGTVSVALCVPLGRIDVSGGTAHFDNLK
jgi:hypothetical protein